MDVPPAHTLRDAVAAIHSSTEALRQPDLDLRERQQLEADVEAHIDAVVAALGELARTT